MPVPAIQGYQNQTFLSAQPPPLGVAGGWVGGSLIQVYSNTRKWYPQIYFGLSTVKTSTSCKGFEAKTAEQEKTATYEGQRVY